jgi:hypothetical protein
LVAHLLFVAAAVVVAAVHKAAQEVLVVLVVEVKAQEDKPILVSLEL